MIKSVFRNLYLLTFLNGFLLASLFYFRMEASFENELFQAISSDISSKINMNDSQDSVVVKAMHECHNLMVAQGTVYEGKEFMGLKSSFLDPTSIDLMTARGACGSYSIVLARILQEYHFAVRIAQMKVKGIFAAHNILEAKTGHGWVVLDPLFNLYFVNPAKTLASFEDVKNNWNFYTRQLPAGYNKDYRYEDVRYSNWSKIPLILPSIKKLLDLILGKQQADKISLRMFFLRKYDLCFTVALIFFLFVLSYSLVRIIKAKVFPQKNIPVTLSNVYKYARLRIFEKEFSEQRRA